MYGTSFIRAPLHRLCTGPHAIFCAEKSALKNTTATAYSNLVHLCNISLVVSRLSEAMPGIKETRLQGATGSVIARKIEDSQRN